MAAKLLPRWQSTGAYAKEPCQFQVGLMKLQTKRHVYAAAALICTLGLTCGWLKASAEAGVMFVYWE